MAAPNKNAFWKLRYKHGRDKIFSDPEELWSAACQYFEWCDNNPLEEEKVFGTGIRLKVNLKRAYTITGLCFYLQIDIRTWNEYRNKYEDFFPVISRVEQVMYTQKFEGAAVGLFNANIISRDLGLVDKKGLSDDEPLKNGFDALMSRLKNKENDK